MTRIDTIGEHLKSRNSAVTILCIGSLAILILLSLPIAAAFQAQDTRTRASLLKLSVARAEAAAIPTLRDQLKGLQQQISVSPGAVRGASVALAQAQLQQAFDSIATTNGAWIHSTQMPPADHSHGFEIVAINEDLTVPMSKLGDLVYAVETRTPYLFLDNVQIAGSQPWQAPNALAQEPQLSVRWTAHAYRWSAR